MWSSEFLAKACNAVVSGPTQQFAAVAIDTRTLQPGSLYVALHGENFDGHRFVAQAIAARVSSGCGDANFGDQIEAVERSRIDMKLNRHPRPSQPLGVFEIFFEEYGIGQNQVDPRQVLVREPKPAIDRQQLPVGVHERHLRAQPGGRAPDRAPSTPP